MRVASVCGSAPWQPPHLRKAGCGTTMVTVPDSGTLEYCPVCHPLTGERDMPYTVDEDGAYIVRPDVERQYGLT